MRKPVFIAILLLGVFFVITRMAEVEEIVRTSQQGDWRFFLLALTAVLAWLINVAVSYKTIFQATGIDEKFIKLILLAAAANFVNVVAPSAGVGGMAVFVSEAQRRGYSTGRVTMAGVLYVLFDYAGFLCVLFLGLIVLIRRHNLTAAEVAATTLLVLIAAAMAAFIYIGMQSSKMLRNVLVWMARRINRLLWPFIHRPYLSEERAHSFAQDAAAGLVELRRNPQSLITPFGLALSNKTLLISILFFVFLAYKTPFSIGTLVAGFSVAYLFLIISPTPSGIGVVEGVMTLVLRSLYVPWGLAALITLTYRGFTFWLPLIFGLIAFRYISRSAEAEKAI